MILAGIDEAGYGPLLGPLVVGCCAFRVDGGCEGELEAPCLWKRLRRVVSRTRDRKGIRLHINDSKQVYSPAAGLKELERSVLAMSAAALGPDESLRALLQRLAPHALEDLPQHPWYAPAEDERFPLEHEPAAIRMSANSLRIEMDRCETRCAHLAARVILERRLNAQLEQTRNKSSVLFSAAAMHLDHLLRNFAGEGLVIVCDRQGGREHYGHLLRLMFEDWSLEVLRECESISEYRMRRGELSARLVFREKAEAQCLPVAVASMLCKYLREALMRRFNAWWRRHLPDLEPTAGYYSDGLRFLRDIDAKRAELGIAEAELVRMR